MIEPAVPAPPIIGSTGSTTFVLVALLVALGIGMLVVCRYLVRSTRTDTPALGPLEVMGDRRFARRDIDARATALTSARPDGALGPAPTVDIIEPESQSESEEGEVPSAVQPDDAPPTEADADETSADLERPVEADAAPAAEAVAAAADVAPAEDAPVEEAAVDEPVADDEPPGDEDDVVAVDEPAEATPGAH